MAEPLKQMYSPVFFEHFCKLLQNEIPAFKKQAFINQVFDKDWEDRALKNRVQHIAQVLGQHLRGDFRLQVDTIIRLIQKLEESGISGGFQYIFFAQFIDEFGRDDIDTSLYGIERITQFISCEFAIRYFIMKEPKKLMKQMLSWSLHPHPHVRRLASEGCRPRLPWAAALPFLKADATPVLPILENLKADPSLFVRKSVANNLNDIAKDHPQVMIDKVKSWDRTVPGTAWIVRHASRGLLKQAHPSAYQLFDLKPPSGIDVSQFVLSKKKIRLGDSIRFSFELEVHSKRPAKVRLEYAVYYKKANGKQLPKIFQISEKEYRSGERVTIARKQVFKDFTTRKHHPGEHRIAIIVNGKEMATGHFELTC